MQNAAAEPSQCQKILTPRGKRCLISMAVILPLVALSFMFYWGSQTHPLMYDNASDYLAACAMASARSLPQQIRDYYTLSPEYLEKLASDACFKVCEKDYGADACRTALNH